MGLIHRVPLLSPARGCVAAWATDRYGPSHVGTPGDTANNARLLDFIGNSRHAQYGSTTGSDSNDPQYVEPDRGKWWAFFPGVGGNLLLRSVPSGWAGKSSGTFDLICRVYFDSVTPSAIQYMMGSTGSRFGFALNTDGKPRLTVDNNAGTTITASASAAVGFAAGAWVWMKTSYSWTTGNAQFFTSTTDTDDPTAVVWTQLGTDVSATIAQINNTITQLVAGQRNQTSTSPLSGGLRYAAWYLDGVLSTGIDLTQPGNYNSTQTSVIGLSGNAWTITRVTTAGRPLAIVDSRMLIEGTDDYLQVANDAAFDPGTADFTAFALVRHWNPAAFGYAIAKKASDATADNGWMAGITNAGQVRVKVTDGTNVVLVTGPSVTAGARQIVGVRIRRAPQLVDAFVVSENGGFAYVPADISSVGALANTSPLTMGADSSAGGRFAGVHKGGGYFNRALTDAELRQLPQAMNAGFVGF